MSTCRASEEMNENCYVFADICCAILPPLLLADGGFFSISHQLSYTLKELHRVFPIAFGHFPGALLYPFNSAQRLDNNL